MNRGNFGEHQTERKQRLARLCAAFAILFGIAIVAGAPAATDEVYAADYEYWEDCDWDGYDDHTGVKVPWVGFDGTRGDTPAGPSATSQTGKKKQEEKASSSASSSTSASSSGSSSSASSSGSSDTSKSSGSSGTQSSSGKSAPAKSSAETGTAKKESASTNATKNTNENKPSAADKTDAEAEAAEVPADVEEAGSGDEAVDDSAEIVETGGSIEITETEGSAFHVGSSVRITGSGFYGNVEDIDIEIHSTPKNLAKVTSSADGSFEATVSIPDDIEAGSHTIVVLYHGAELASTPIEVGPQPADSFLKAIAVGFTDASRELVVGAILLASLLVISVAGLTIHAIRRRRRGNVAKTEN